MVPHPIGINLSIFTVYGKHIGCTYRRGGFEWRDAPPPGTWLRVRPMRVSDLELPIEPTQKQSRV